MSGEIDAGWDDGLLQHADVPLDQIESAIDHLAHQLVSTGGSPVPLLRARYDLAVHRFGHAGAEHPFEQWAHAAAERDAADATPMASASAAATGVGSWCPHCERADQVEHLVMTDRHAEAVRFALPMLDAAPSTLCPEQPAGVIATVLPSLLITGQAGRAAAEHLRSVRLLERSAASGVQTRARAAQLLVCARTGRLQHGLDLLAEWLGWYAVAAPPFARMQVAAAAARVLRGASEAGNGDVLLQVPHDPDGPAVSQNSTSGPSSQRGPRGPLDDTAGIPIITQSGQGTRATRGTRAGLSGRLKERITVDELGSRLLREARELAARFDVRNQTQATSDLVDGLLDASPLPDLPLDAVLRSPRSAQAPVRRPAGPRGRRALAQDKRPGPPLAVETRVDLGALVREFDAALRTDSEAGRSTALDTWRTVRAAHELDVGDEAKDAARLDGWLAIERLHERPAGDSSPAAATRRPGWAGDDPNEDGGPMEQAMTAARRLAVAGLPVEALLHGQAALFAAAQIGVAEPVSVQDRIRQIADEVADQGSAPDQGLAYSRVALIRELVASTAPADVVDADASSDAADPQTDPVELGLAAFDTAEPADLDHQHLRALCRLLRLRAADEDPAGALATLRQAVDVLPDGVRPLERALARTDLAALLQDQGNPVAALAAWQAAVADAAVAGAEPLLGNLLAAGAQVKQALGDVDGAVGDLTQAVPLIDQFGAPELAAQARFDLSRALIEQDRYFEAATAAESALADLTELMPPPPRADQALAHLAGCAAFAAAEAIAATGDPQQGRVLAELSAGWHEANGNLAAEAEAWQLAARIGGPARRVAGDLERAAELAEAGGEWSRAATCRRDRATAVKEADGIDAALEVLDDAEKALVTRDALAGRHMAQQDAQANDALLSWHRLVLSEQRARFLAVAGRFAAALDAVEGLETGYTSLGDNWSARDLLGLRGQLRAELGDLGSALRDLERAAQEALDAGDRDQAHGLGERLATVLDQAGRRYDAEDAYHRFCITPLSVTNPP